MKGSTRQAAFLLLLIALAVPVRAWAQAGFDDDRVMLQGFYWESHRHGDPDPRFAQFGTKRWYQIVKEQAGAIRDGRFDLIWLPPPSYAGGRSAGYNPKQYWRLDNSYGDFNLHRAMLEELLAKGAEPIADIVINHRDGNTDWADFKNPDWGVNTICRRNACVTALAILPAASDNASMAKKKRAPKTPDPAAFGFGVMQHIVEATGDTPEEPGPALDLAGKDPAAVALGRKGGLKGGPARAKKLGKKKLREAAKKAAAARWRKNKAK
jgi:hypothetical protein